MISISNEHAGRSSMNRSASVGAFAAVTEGERSYPTSRAAHQKADLSSRDVARPQSLDEVGAGLPELTSKP